MTRNLSLCVLMLLLAATVAQALTWTATSSLPVGRRNATVVYYNGYVYVIGGRTAEEAPPEPNPHAVATVYFGPVASDGSITTWTVTSSLPEALAAHGAAAHDGYVYAFGGWRADYNTTNNCYFAQILPDGSVDSWTTSSVTIPDSGAGYVQMEAFGNGVSASSDTLYIVNGGDEQEGFPGLHSEVYYCRIQTNHDYGTWVLTHSTPQKCWFHGVATYEGISAKYIYRVCGSSSGVYLQETYYNEINPDGSLTNGTWANTTGWLPSGLCEFACAIGAGRIFVIGGLSNSTSQNTVFYGNINPGTGDIASWTQDGSPYPITVSRFAAVAYPAGGHQYVLGVGGGRFYSWDAVFGDCYYAQIDVPSEVTDWALYE